MGANPASKIRKINQAENQAKKDLLAKEQAFQHDNEMNGQEIGSIVDGLTLA